MNNIGKIISFLILFTFSGNLLAADCNFDKIRFNSKAYIIIDKYNLDDEFYEPNKDIIEIPAMGMQICHKLPNNTLADFTFIKDKFVKLLIKREKNADDDNQLLKFMEKTFGEAEKKAKTNKTALQNIWAEDKDKLIFYSTHKDGSKLVEYFELTSKKHGYLFKKNKERLEKNTNKALNNKD